MEMIDRRQALRLAGMCGAGVASATLLSGCLPAAAGALEGSSSTALSWLATMGEALVGAEVGHWVSQRSDFSWGNRDWGRILGNAANAAISNLPTDWQFYDNVFGFLPQNTKPVGGLALVAKGERNHALEAALLFTRDTSIILDWWARQALAAVYETTDRRGLDKAARIHEKFLFKMSTVPRAHARHWTSEDKRTTSLSYFPLLGGPRVVMTYGRDSNGDERVNLTLPAFKNSENRSAWTVKLDRKL